LARNVISPVENSKEVELSRKNEKIKDRAILLLFRNIVLCNTKEGVDAALTIARFLNSEGVGDANYHLYLLLLETNNSYVIDGLIGRRKAFLLFSSINPNWYMLKETFRILARFKRGELYEKGLLSFLGIIQNAYKSSKFGFGIYQLSISDVYNIGKYMDKKKGQKDATNRLLLNILFDIYDVGVNSRNMKIKRVAIMANNIRMSFFDERKDMSDAIPDVLLLLSDFRKRQIKPGIKTGNSE
jgi:hypothetical protein